GVAALGRTAGRGTVADVVLAWESRMSSFPKAFWIIIPLDRHPGEAVFNSRRLVKPGSSSFDFEAKSKMDPGVRRDDEFLPSICAVSRLHFPLHFPTKRSRLHRRQVRVGKHQPLAPGIVEIHLHPRMRAAAFDVGDHAAAELRVHDVL